MLFGLFGLNEYNSFKITIGYIYNAGSCSAQLHPYSLEAKQKATRNKFRPNFLSAATCQSMHHPDRTLPAAFQLPLARLAAHHKYLRARIVPDSTEICPKLEPRVDGVNSMLEAQKRWPQQAFILRKKLCKFTALAKTKSELSMKAQCTWRPIPQILNLCAVSLLLIFLYFICACK